MKKILLTGFSPFGEESLNPSEILLSELSSKFVGKKLLLPVAYEKSFALVGAELDSSNYDFVLMLGQAGGRNKVGMERFLVNLADAELADQDQMVFREKIISLGGPVAFQAPLPLREWWEEAKLQKLPLEISNSAGTYVCNYLSYRVAEKLAGSTVKSLFVHLPFLPEQVQGKPVGISSLPLVDMKNCVEFILKQISGQSADGEG